MNSLMQQFYMIPEFRYKLLSVLSEEDSKEVPEGSKELQEKKEKLKDNMLYQLQTMLSNLQESEKRFYDTKDFCKAYKPDGQPVNPTIQMDADEFFNMLFDKLEHLLRESKQVSELLKTSFLY
jgi:ubiquitin carboxyl-terminal hydrolase 34